MSLGLGDDQAQGGYEAALDVWSPAVWRAARAVAGPLPPGTPQVQLAVLTRMWASVSMAKQALMPAVPSCTGHG